MKKHIFYLLISLQIFSCSYKNQINDVPEKLVVLTFDDAPASQYAVVAPLLQEFGFGATFYVCEFPPNYQDSTLYMNWRQIQALDRMGFEIANHTRSHAKITELSQTEFNAELEYIDHKCDSLGIPISKNFAYPGYRLNAEILEYLKEKNYRMARAGGSRPYDPLNDHPYLIPSWATDENNKREIMEALQKAKDGKIVVLTLHGVPDIEHPWVNTPPELFREYLQYLADNGYTVISMRDLEKYIDFEEAMKLEKDLSKPLKN